MITDICEKTKTIHPSQLRAFYRINNDGSKRYITQQEIADRMNLSDSRSYRCYIVNKTKSSYRMPSSSVFRLSWFIAQELLAEGWQIQNNLFASCK